MGTNANVLYIEPNYNRGIVEDLVVYDNNKTVVHEMMPPLEDYCIYVDLEVFIPQRDSYIGLNDEGETIGIQFNTDMKGNQKINFNGGRRFKFNDIKAGVNKDVNYLTTDPNEISTFEDAKKKGTNECFGIKSIDIMYNNYAVPEVNIEFTDVRGISLFSPEELRHGATNSDGDSGYIDSNVAGSFFKCFFSFPYPKFKLTIKGFYGEPVSYDLTCSDARINYDSQSGNFGLTAKFVGYAYSLLNDVTLTSLIVAPYNEYIGKKYWEENCATKFALDGKQMPTFIDIINKLKTIKESLNAVGKDSELAKEGRKIDEMDMLLKRIYESMSNYYKSLIDIIKSVSGDDAKNLLQKPSSYSFALYNDSREFKLSGDNESKLSNLEDSYQNVCDIIVEYNQKFGKNLSKPKKVTFSEDEFKRISEISSDIDEIEFSNKESISEDYTSNSNTYVLLYNNVVLFNIIDNEKTVIANKMTKIQSEIADMEKVITLSHLGFKPTVKNVTSILMAHFDTFIHTIFACKNEVNQRKINGERSASKLGLNLGKTDLTNTSNGVSAFPKVVNTDKVVNGVSKEIETWLGDLSGGFDEPEVKMVEGMLKATNNVTSILEATKSEIESSTSVDDKINLSMKIPLTALDFMLESNPFGVNGGYEDTDGYLMNYSDFSDFAGRVCFRLFSLFGLSDVYDEPEKMGKADAINFANEFNTPTKKFVNKLKYAFSVDNFIHVIKNDGFSNLFKVNGKFCWDSNEDSVSSALVKEDSSWYKFEKYDKLILNKYFEDKTKIQYLPIQGINWNIINSDLGTIKNPSNDKLYISNAYTDNLKNDFIFVIDEDYKKYSSYASFISVDDETLPYVENLVFNFDALEYYRLYCDGHNIKPTYESNGSPKLVSANNGSNTIPYVKTKLEEGSSIRWFSGNKFFNVNEFYDKLYYYNEDDKAVKIYSRKITPRQEISEHIDNPIHYTIPNIGVPKENNSSDFKLSLFSSEFYYHQTSLEMRAILFLKSIDGINSLSPFKLSKIGGIVDENEIFSIVPYRTVLLLGGYLWREEEIQNNEDPFKNIGEFNIDTNNFFKYDKKILALRKEIKDKLISKFKKWVSSKYGFTYFKSAFELNPIKDITQLELIVDFKKKIKGNSFYRYNFNIEDYLYENFDNNFYNNYITFIESGGNILLHTRENAEAVIKLTEFVMKPCMVVKPMPNFMFNKNNELFKISLGYCKDYLKSFLKELNNQYSNILEDKKETQATSIVPIKTSEDIKIGLYKYLKNLYDRWISCTKEKDWSYDEFYEKNWHFLDSYYNIIGDNILINITNVASTILYSQTEGGYSMLSFISSSYAKDGFGFYTVQNFIDLSKKDILEKTEKMFDLIPFNSIKFGNIRNTPSFIVMYSHEYSSKLNDLESDFKSDSFDINDDSNLPKPILNKDLGRNGYRVPAFGVSYGKQYQSYFKDIDVSTENATLTEQVIRAQFRIAGENSKTGENGKNVTFLSQDLYTIYSNNSYTCKVTMMGCAWIQPLMYFQLTNIPMFRGTYLIHKVTHRIVPGNMETTFYGKRLANVSVNYVKDFLINKTNDETYMEKMENIENQSANVYNDCDYKFFNPLLNTDELAMPEEVLNMTLTDYEKYVGSSFKISFDKNSTVKELIGSVIASEAGNQDKLGQELVANVLFNRYMHYGKNLTKVIYGNQHAYDKIAEENSDYCKIAEEIFTKSPKILIGETTKVGRQVPIWDNGVKGGLTKPKTINKHDVQTIDGYCTTNGYDTEYPRGENIEPIGWWQKSAKYVAQHDKSKETMGHVLVAGFMEYDKVHWNYDTSLQKSSINENPSMLAKNLFESISKTVEYTKSLNIDDLKMEKSKENNPNVFYVKCKSNYLTNSNGVTTGSGIIDIFDIVVNTYSDFIKEVNWIVENDAKEIPSMIRIYVNTDTKSSKSISVGKLKTNGSVEVYSQYEGLNEHFYKVLNKRYGTINNTNKNDFKLECKNFTNLTKSNDWVDKVNKLFKVNKVEECGKIVTSAIISGFTWNGTNHAANSNTPVGTIEQYNPSGAAKTAWDNKKRIGYAKNNGLGSCALYVRKAMQANYVGNALDVRPESACKYADFLANWGFDEVHSGFGGSLNGYKPEPGDISVIAGKIDGNEDNLHGHIQIYYKDEDNGNGYWVSDYAGFTAWCYQDPRPYKVFRWKGNDNIA